jgi:hypothetical protein
MSLPTQPAGGAAEVPAEPSAWTVETPPWPLAAPIGAWPTGSGGVPTPAPPEKAPGHRRPLLLAAIAIAGVLAGAVVTAILVTTAFLAAAEDIGRGMSEGLGSDIGRSVGEGLSQGMRDALAEGPGPAGAPAGPVEQFPAVEPGPLGPDPVLDAYAESCFGGDLQACDDLWYEAAPLSDYEGYAATCGGRVKRDAVPACTDLD